MTAPVPTTAAGTAVRVLRLVLCRWDGGWYGLEASRVRGLESAPPRAVPTLGALLGLAPAGPAPAPGRLLRVATGQGEFGFAVGEPVLQAEVAAAAIRALPPILASRLRLPWVRALALCPDLGAAPVVILDFTRGPMFRDNA